MRQGLRTMNENRRGFGLDEGMEKVIDQKIRVTMHVVGDQDRLQEGGGRGGESRGWIRRGDEVFGEFGERRKHDDGEKFQV